MGAMPFAPGAVPFTPAAMPFALPRRPWRAPLHVALQGAGCSNFNAELLSSGATERTEPR